MPKFPFYIRPKLYALECNAQDKNVVEASLRSTRRLIQKDLKEMMRDCYTEPDKRVPLRGFEPEILQKQIRDIDNILDKFREARQY